MQTKQHGKLRLLYEAAPLAFIVAQTGGRASDGKGGRHADPARGVAPAGMLFIGSREVVDEVEEFIRQFG